MQRLLAASCLLIAAAPSWAAGSDLTRLLPPEPTVVIGARLRSILDSDLFRSGGASPLSMDQELKKLAQMIGFNPAKDVDEVILTTTGTGENPPFLIVARGRFNLSVLPAEAPRYRDVPLIDTGKSAVFALLDAETALAGDAAEVRAAIDRRETSSAGPAGPSRASVMSSRYDIWGFGVKPSGFIPAKSAAPSGLDGVEQFEFGVLWSRGLQISADLQFSDVKAATELARGVAQLQALLQMQQPSTKSLKLETRMSGKTLHFGLSVPEEEIKKALASRVSPTPVVAATPAKRSGPPVALPLVISEPVAPARAGDAPAVVRLPGGSQ